MAQQFPLLNRAASHTAYCSTATTRMPSSQRALLTAPAPVAKGSPVSLRWCRTAYLLPTSSPRPSPSSSSALCWFTGTQEQLFAAASTRGVFLFSQPPLSILQDVHLHREQIRAAQLNGESGHQSFLLLGLQSNQEDFSEASVQDSQHSAQSMESVTISFRL